MPPDRAQVLRRVGPEQRIYELSLGGSDSDIVLSYDSAEQSVLKGLKCLHLAVAASASETVHLMHHYNTADRVGPKLTIW
jgi:hypothetical protein